MAEEQKKSGRETNVTGKGKGLKRRGEGLGTGPVGSEDGYAGKKGEQDKGLMDQLLINALSGGAGSSGSTGSSAGSGMDLTDLLSALGGGSTGSTGSTQSASTVNNILGGNSSGSLNSLLGGNTSHAGQSINLNDLTPAQQQQLIAQLQAMQQQQNQQQYTQQQYSQQQAQWQAQQQAAQQAAQQQQTQHQAQQLAAQWQAQQQAAHQQAQQTAQQQTQQANKPSSSSNILSLGGSSGSGGSGGSGGGGNSGSGGTGKKKKSILPYILIALVLIFVLPRLFSCGSGSAGSVSQSNSGQSVSSNTGNTGNTGNAGTSSSTQNAGTVSNAGNAGSTSNAGQAGNAGNAAGATQNTFSNAAAAGNNAGSTATHAATASSTSVSNSGYNPLSALFGGSSGNYDTWGNEAGITSNVNTAVADGSRDKYTTILGGGKDTVTVMIYMCGTDLESKSGMGTSDLMEMTKANIASNVNVLVYTGGCKRWNNQVVSSSVNQIYKVESGGLARVVENAGSPAMTDPSTLASFIQWCAQNYPANRNELILWDHGSGSVAGYAYDEKSGSQSSMTLAGISKALTNGGVKFDFIGFDACLMATAENALMLDNYGDYLVASEETEPGVGWYYTDWLTALSSNTSMPTLEIGKNIVDGFVETCARKCPGQKTTLSVIDLAEFAYTVPDTLSSFATSVSSMVNGGQYQTVSNARYKAREFATSSKIDQVDLIDLANKIGTSECAALVDSLKGAIKYNRTSSDMTNAYGVAIYFPYRRLGYVNSAVQTYTQIGTPDAYTKCIQDVAGMTTSGQVASGGYSSPFESLFGSGYSSGGYGSSGYGSGSSGSSSSGYSSSSAYGDTDMITALLSSFLGGDVSSMTGGSSSSSSYDYYFGRSIPVEEDAAYIAEHMLNPADLVWQENENGDLVLSLTDEDWENVHDLDLNAFYDDGEGYIDLGLDNRYSADENGNLVADTARTWLAINDQIVAYYHIDTVDDGTNYKITGRVPVYLNGDRADLMIVFDNEHPTGYIAGATYVVDEGGLSLIGKSLVAVGEGDEEDAEEVLVLTEGEPEENEISDGSMVALSEGDVIDFVCDYYSYEGNYEDSYYLGDPMTVTGEMVVSDVELPDDGEVVWTYRLTDLYDRQYWTESIKG